MVSGPPADALPTQLDARYVFRLSAPLDAGLQERARALPGMFVRGRGRRLDVPFNAGWVVSSWLDALGISYQVDEPRFAVPVNVESVEAVSRASEAHAWLWDKKEDNPPTTSEPLRLLPFQKEAIAAFAPRGGGHMWAPAGSGKTLSLHVWAFLNPGPFVIVTKADAREVHRREMTRCTEAVPFVWKPLTAVRRRDKYQSVWEYLFDAFGGHTCRQQFRPVIIVGWEMLPSVVDTLISEVCPAILGADESHKIKSPKRWRWTPTIDDKLRRDDIDNITNAAFRLACSCRYRLATTATAIRHRTWDLWGQASLIEPRAWGITGTKFFLRHCDARAGEFGGLWKDGLSNESELKGRLSFTVVQVPYHLLAEQLQPKRRQVIRVPPELLVRSMAREREVATTEDAVKKKARTGDKRALRGTHTYRLMDAASRKRGHVKRLVTEYVSPTGPGKRKILVFTGRHRDCEELGRQLEPVVSKQNGTCWTSHGGLHTVAERQEIEDAYMAHPGPAVLVGTRQAWGESKNLQQTDVLLVVMLPYTPGEVDQNEGRVHRLGMDRPVLIVYVVAEDTIDERVASVMLDKLPAVVSLTGGGALDGLMDGLMGLEDRAAVEASLSSMFDDLEE